MSDWPDGAVEYVQSIADTKLVLGHRYAQWTLAGPSLEDDMGGASAAQEETGHVRQLFRLLEDQGRDGDWLHGDRDPTEFRNAKSLDSIEGSWTRYMGTVAPTDRAAWYLLDAINHDDFTGMADKIGEDEYFHLEYHDARLEALADEDPETLQTTLEDVLPDVLAFIGPATYDADTDPLVASGFTDRPVAELRRAFLDHYDTLFEGTDVSLADIDRDSPELDSWDDARRRVNGGGISDTDIEQLRGTKNEEFAME